MPIALSESSGGRLRQNENKHKIEGVVVGIVTKLAPDDDPIGHRVKVKFPFLSESDESDWARLCTFGAGDKRGMYCMPEVGDEVVCAFEHGDIARPYVIGTVWNGKDKAIRKLEDKKNEHRVFVSRSGHQLEFYDKKDNEKITLKSQKGAYVIIDDKDEKITVSDHTGDNYVEIDHKNKKITVESKTGDIVLKAKEKIQLDCKNLEIKSSQKTSFDAGTNFEVQAKSNMQLKASGQGNVESSGTMTMKGATVNIN